MVPYPGPDISAGVPRGRRVGDRLRCDVLAAVERRPRAVEHRDRVVVEESAVLGVGGGPGPVFVWVGGGQRELRSGEPGEPARECERVLRALGAVEADDDLGHAVIVEAGAVRANRTEPHVAPGNY
jgi:hypothetical protein